MTSARAAACFCQVFALLLTVGCSKGTKAPTEPQPQAIYPSAIAGVTVPDSIAAGASLRAIVHVPHRSDWALIPPVQALATDGALLLEPKVFYTGDSLPTGLPAGPSVFDDWSVGAEGLPPGLRTVRAVGSNGAVDVNVFVGAPSAVHDFVHRIEILTGAGVPVAGIEIIVRSAESGTRELTRVVTDAAGKAEIVLPGTGASQIGISEEWVSTTPGAEGWVLLYVLLERDVPKRTRFGGVSSS